MLSGILLKREAIGIELLGYLPFPDDLAADNLFDCIGIDVTIRRFLCVKTILCEMLTVPGNPPGRIFAVSVDKTSRPA
jgi:hypothetical protein